MYWCGTLYIGIGTLLEICDTSLCVRSNLTCASMDYSYTLTYISLEQLQVDSVSLKKPCFKGIVIKSIYMSQHVASKKDTGIL